MKSSSLFEGILEFKLWICFHTRYVFFELEQQKKCSAIEKNYVFPLSNVWFAIFQQNLDFHNSAGSGSETLLSDLDLVLDSDKKHWIQWFLFKMPI
jgi:hypothetical protein